MIAPASVPQVMIVASFHQSVSLPLMFPIRAYEAMYVATIDVTDATHTRGGGGLAEGSAERGFPRSVSWPLMFPIRAYEAMYVATIDVTDATHTRVVSGTSK